jgi:serine/threonine protein kinase
MNLVGRRQIDMANASIGAYDAGDPTLPESLPRPRARALSGELEWEPMANDRLLGRDFGRYRVEAVIGRGGMGVVYRARDRKLDRVVALKVLSDERAADPSFRERFLRESRLLASIDHPNIVPVYEADEADDDLFIAMRFVQGPELRRIIERDGPLNPSRAVTIIAQVADALDAAHAAGLIHRDIKPANILVVSGPSADHAYLTDFGLTKLAGESTGLTQAGQFVGTPGYVAPEQIKGKGVDHRADVYALGCVLYDCLTGVVPYPRDSTMASLWAHVHEPPPKPSDQRPSLPAELDGVIAKALAKRPGDRYQTAGGLAFAARKAIPATEPSLPTVVMDELPDEPEPAPLTGVADPTTAVALATVVAGGTVEATELASAATHLDSTPPTEVGSSGGPPMEPRRGALGAGGFGRRSVPAIGIAIAVIVALAASALAFGTGVLDLTGARNALPTGSGQANAVTPKPAFITSAPSSEPSASASEQPTPTPTRTPRPTPRPTATLTPRDRIPPTGTSIRIAGGKGTVYDTRRVTLSLTASDSSKPIRMRLGNKTGGTCRWAAWRTFSRSYSGWTLGSGGGGQRSVCAQFQDGETNVSGVRTDGIYYDRKPTAHNHNFGCSNTYSTVNLTPFNSGQLYRDTDPDRDPLTIVSAAIVSGVGSVTRSATAVHYKNPNSADKYVRIRYTIADNHGGRDSGIFHLYIKAVYSGCVEGTVAQ